MSPLASIRGTGGTLNDTAVVQNQNTLSHPKSHTKGEFIDITEGSGSWTVPPGVTKICIVVVGGGGGGPPYGISEKAGGGGGGGGLTYGNNITVKPGDSLPYYVGEGGSYYASSGVAEDGDDTWIKNVDGDILVEGEGGEGGEINIDYQSPGTNTYPSRQGGQGGFGGRSGPGSVPGPSGWGTVPYSAQGIAVSGGGDGGPGSDSKDLSPTSPTPGTTYTYFSKGGGGGGAGGWSNDGTPSHLQSGGRGGINYVRYGGGGSFQYYYEHADDGLNGGAGGGSGRKGGGGVGLYGQGANGEGGRVFPSYMLQPAEGGSPSVIQTENAYDAGEKGAGSQVPVTSGGGSDGTLSPGYSVSGGGVGGGGHSGQDWEPAQPENGSNGANGAIRIVWGCGVSFPDNADGHYPTPS